MMPQQVPSTPFTPYPWPEPTQAMLEDPRFWRIWQAIRMWEIAVPGCYEGSCEARGTHVRAILEALDAAPGGR